MNNSKDKIHIVTMGDSPLLPSGVGRVTKQIISGLLDKDERYSFTSLGGMIKPPDYKPIRTEEFSDRWTIWPTEGYGTPQLIRDVLWNERPAAVMIFTDPRYWTWLWQSVEAELRYNTNLIYYHVWDNGPAPFYNKKYYESNDVIATISKLTDNIVEAVAPDVDRVYIPHTVEEKVFYRWEDKKTMELKKQLLGEENKDKFIYFFNSRNARRKHSGTLIWWFKDVLDKIGHDNATLIMHTNPKDDYGPDLDRIIKDRGLDNGQVKISAEKISDEQLIGLYNLADVVLAPSDAEGWGLSLIESLACETPIICTMTGGMQQQVTDGHGNWFGIGIKPSSQMLVGCQNVPYIYEDRISNEDFVKAAVDMYKMSPESRKEMGKKGREYVLREYSMDQFLDKWDTLFKRVVSEYGSWPNRKYNKRYELWEVK